MSEDIKIVLSQGPDGTDEATATEALNTCVGNTVDAIALLWERAKPSSSTKLPDKPTFLDPVAAKWASVRDISDSISECVHIARQKQTPPPPPQQ